MTRIIVALSLIFGCVLCVDECQAQVTSNEKNDLTMANHAILETLALHGISPYICTEQPAACVAPDGIELGTALIAARNTPDSLRALVRLHRFSLDGGYSETFDQLLCEKSKSVEKYLSALNPDDLRQQCVNEVEAAKKSTSSLKQLRVEHVCASIKDIRSSLDQTLQMVRNPPKSCEP